MTARGLSRCVVVTGAAGFIGSNLVDSLLAEGHSVVGLDRRSPHEDVQAAVNLVGALPQPAFTFVHADISTDDIADVMTGAEVVFHLAAVPGVRASWGQRFEQYAATNLLGTRRVLEACRQAGIRRLVFASSSSVYGPAEGPSRETDPTAPISPYGVTKLAGEHLCHAYAVRGDVGLSVVALRYFTVYGPRQRPDMAISRILSAALFGRKVTLYGDGTQRREFTFVGDAVAATMAAADLDVPWAVVNVGGGSSVTLIDVIRLAHEVTGQPVPLTAVEPQPGDVPATAADLSVARSLLRYRPECPLRTGMQLQTLWLRLLPPELVDRFAPAEPALTEVSR
jgi:nucleoside-diphosphate-sugar epimerase